MTLMDHITHLLCSLCVPVNQFNASLFVLGLYGDVRQHRYLLCCIWRVLGDTAMSVVVGDTLSDDDHVFYHTVDVFCRTLITILNYNLTRNVKESDNDVEYSRVRVTLNFTDTFSTFRGKLQNLKAQLSSACW